MQRSRNISKTAKIAVLCGLGAMAFATSGCTRLRGHQGYVGEANLLQSVQAGVDNKQSVQATLGRPTFTGQFDQNDWYYYARDTRQLAFSRPKAKEQSIYHIRFDDAGNVLAVNTSGIETIAKISPSGDKTPTAGREKSFFQELFGNIGRVGAPGTGGGGAPR